MAGRIIGQCPACGGSTLRYAPSTLGVVCTRHGCPRPSAVDEILAIATPDHEVELLPTGFAMKHPLLERVDDQLFDCPLFKHLDAIMKGESDGYAPALGRYWVSRVGDEWAWREA